MKGAIRVSCIFVFFLILLAKEENTMAVEDTIEYPLSVFFSYIKMIKNSIGSKMFRNLYFIKNNKNLDVLRNGNLSCAYYVSSILKHFDLIGELRTSVEGLVLEMEKNGWIKNKRPRVGSIIVWDSRYFRNSKEYHGHIGFYIGNGLAVSSSSKRGAPVRHNWQKEPYGTKKRKVVKILWHPLIKSQSR